MKCPFCSHEDSKVTDSRNATESSVVRRRRECVQCARRFTTFETVDLSLQVKKRDGTYEDFQQEKLTRGIDAACRHTTVSHQRACELADQIMAELLTKGVREIESRELGEIVMRHLQRIDVIAYIRFACVYKRFTQIRELLEAIQSVYPNDLKNWDSHHAKAPGFGDRNSREFSRGENPNFLGHLDINTCKEE